MRDIEQVEPCFHIRTDLTGKFGPLGEDIVSFGSQERAVRLCARTVSALLAKASDKGARLGPQGSVWPALAIKSVIRLIHRALRHWLMRRSTRCTVAPRAGNVEGV